MSRSESSHSSRSESSRPPQPPHPSRPVRPSRPSQPVVAVVGGAGFIGRALCAELRGRGAGVVVVDRAVAPYIDIAAASAVDALARSFGGVDAVVHLAARVDPPNAAERGAMRRLHLDGPRAVLAAAARARVLRFVLASSAVVYGARATNRVPFDESTPIAPNDDFAYAVDKAAQERIAAGAADETADADADGFMRVAVARPAIVYGPGARNYLTEIIRKSPFLPALDGRRPQLQFVHVDDVARALAFLAVDDAGRRATGAFNVAPADWLALEDVAAIAKKRIVDVPARFVGPVVDALARFMPSHLRAPASMLPYLMHPFVLSSQKLAAAGCPPLLSSEQALRSILR